MRSGCRSETGSAGAMAIQGAFNPGLACVRFSRVRYSRRMSDVLVIGGGLAGLCAAIAARKRGASVRLVENAPYALRGGNARHARNFRAAHSSADLVFARCLYDGRIRSPNCTGSPGTKRRSARAFADRRHHKSRVVAYRLRRPPPGSSGGFVPFSRRTAFLLGGGKAMLNALYENAAKIGVSSAMTARLSPWSGAGRHVECRGRVVRRHAADRGALRRCRRPAAPAPIRNGCGRISARPRTAIGIRGGSYSNGRAMQVLIEAGARTVGDPATCHTVAVDARGPRFDGGIVTRITAIPYGLVVDRQRQRASTSPVGDAGRSQLRPMGSQRSRIAPAASRS